MMTMYGCILFYLVSSPLQMLLQMLVEMHRCEDTCCGEL